MTRDLADGEETTMKGSGATPYTLRNKGGVYDCTCPSWRNNGDKIKGNGVLRTCKHLKALRGEEAEIARLGGVAPAVKSPERLAAEAGKGRALRGDEKQALYGPKLQHAQRLEDYPGLDPKGWLQSVKLDGVRALWDGGNFISREGNIYPAPGWFKLGMPTHRLDGELWMGRGSFQRCVGVVKSSPDHPGWKDVTYLVYDSPDAPGTFQERYSNLLCEEVYEKTKQSCTLRWSVLQQTPCTTMAQLRADLEAAVAAGDEGLMIRQPGAEYTPGKSGVILKCKLWDDAEAIVVDYTAGKAARAGRVGAITVEMPSGQRFNINAARAEDQRNPPPIGTTVKYKFMALTDDGIPKGASLIGTV